MGGLPDMILKSQNGAGVERLAKNSGISGADATKAIASMLPGLAGGVQKNIASPQGLVGSKDVSRQLASQAAASTRP